MKRDFHGRTAGRARTFLLLAVLALALGVFVQGFRARMGVDREIANFGTGACTVVPAPAGPEDMALDTLTDTVFLSAVDRRDPAAFGDLWSLALTDGGLDAEPVRIERDGPARFRPHGLDLVRTDDGLFAWVVNHPGERHTVEGFTLEEVDGVWRARHEITVAGAALISPNDVAAVDAGHFYVTNDHGTPGGAARLAEDLLGLDLGNVLYFDGERFVEAVGGLSFANGVMLARDGAELVVAEVFRRSVTYHDREPVSGLAQPHLLVDVDSGVDNLTLAADGSIWVAAHPRLFAFTAHASDPQERSPTEVMRIRRTEGGAVVDRILGDDGGLLSGGSVAVPWRDQVLVSGVFEPRLLRCRLPEEFAMAVPAAPVAAPDAQTDPVDESGEVPEEVSGEAPGEVPGEVPGATGDVASEPGQDAAEPAEEVPPATAEGGDPGPEGGDAEPDDSGDAPGSDAD